MQLNPHEPALQVGEAFAGAWHALPHMPQFLVSMVVSTQLPLQFICGGAQTREQCPVTQVMGEVHAVPQPPQLPLSVFVLTHEPLQFV